MNQPVNPGVPSPCISLCKINRDSELCEGCLRTLDEIAAWATSSDEEKRDIWRRIELRKAAPNPHQ